MQTILARLHRSASAVIWTIGCIAGSAHGADVPPNPFNYARTTSYVYDANGNLRSTTTEPNHADACVVRTLDYDDAGNVKSTTLENCTGAPAIAQFGSRTDLISFAAVPSQQIVVNGASRSVAINAGIFETSSQEPLGHTLSRQYDPRFGAVLQAMEANGLSVVRAVDDFGRVIRETAVDGTSVIHYHCVLAGSGLDQSSNTPGCPIPAAGEAPTLAVSFVHAEPRDTSNAKMGPFQRIYLDRLGRAIRTATQSFDGPDQPAGRGGAIVVSDTVYNRFGAKVMETAPYFLASGSSDTSGTNNVGVSMYAYDALGRATAKYTADPNAAPSQTQSFGGAGAVTYGTYGVQRAATTATTYAGLTTTTTNSIGQSRAEERAANGTVVRVTDATGAQIAYQYDAFGGLIRTVDALQNSIATAYDYVGRKIEMNDPDKGLITYGYNALGELTIQQNPLQRQVATQTTLTYDLNGRLKTRAEPEYVSTWYYDTYKDGSPCNRGIGKLCETGTTSGLAKKFVYDDFGRAVNTRQDIAQGPSFATAVSYDAVTGRLTSRTFPTGLQVGYSYTPLGHAHGMTLFTSVAIEPLPATPGGAAGPGASLSAGTALWQALAVNAAGATEQSRSANGVVTRTAREPGSARPASITAGIGSSTTVLNHSYAWDSVSNLVGRIDANGTDANGALNGAVSEVFNYDAVNRLTGYQVSGPSVPTFARSVSLHYNALGMLLHKSDVGNYAYGPSGGPRPHLVRTVTGSTTTRYTSDANGNVTGADGGKYRSLSYTSFDLPDGTTGITGPGQSPAYTWQYDENHARVKEVRVIPGAAPNAGTRTLWYMHPDNVGGLGFESEVNAPAVPSANNPAVTSNRHFLSVGSTVVGALVTTGPLPVLGAAQTAPTPLATFVNDGVRKAVKLEFWHKDHLGSLAATTDHLGAATARYSYDPFGKRRYTSGSYDESGSIVVDWSPAVNHGTSRGFTGHEGLDDIGIVHMNGRLFDPNLGLFLQADPMISDPSNLQNFNRYAYVSNNPLNATDPSGLVQIDAIWRTGVSGQGGGQFALELLHDALAFMANFMATGQLSGFSSGAFSSGATFRAGTTHTDTGGSSNSDSPAASTNNAGYLKPFTIGVTILLASTDADHTLTALEEAKKRQALEAKKESTAAREKAGDAQTHGKPQKTRSPGHDLGGKAIGEAALATGQVERLHYNQQLRTATGNPVVGNKQPDVTILWKDGKWTLVEVGSPSQSLASQVDKAAAMNKSLEAAGLKVREPVVVSIPDAMAGKFTFRASGALASLSLLGGILDLRQAQKENPGLTLIEGLHILNGTPLPQRNNNELH